MPCGARASCVHGGRGSCGLEAQGARSSACAVRGGRACAYPQRWTSDRGDVACGRQTRCAADSELEYGGEKVGHCVGHPSEAVAARHAWVCRVARPVQHGDTCVRRPRHPNVGVAARHAWAWSVVRVPSPLLHDDGCAPSRHPYHPNGGAPAHHVWVWCVERAPSPLHDVCVRRPSPQARECHLNVWPLLLLEDTSQLME